MMNDHDKAVVKYAIATGVMPLHEQRDDYLEYQVKLVNDNRSLDLKDLKDPKDLKNLKKSKNKRLLKQLKVPSTEEKLKALEAELEEPLTVEKLKPLVRATDELKGQKYCNCFRNKCPLRMSFDCIDSSQPHVIGNLQPLMICTNRFKGSMPDHDFRVLISDFKGQNKALKGTEAPLLEDAPIKKKCGDCSEWKLFDQFSKDTVSHDGLRYKCKTCDAEKNRNNRKRKRKRMH